jgi:hypothetical protein
MRRKIAAVLFGAALGLGVASPALADQPPGQLGYEGQPGNQGGASGQPPGQLGYEGQPGNQGGGSGQPPGLLGYEGQPGNQGG